MSTAESTGQQWDKSKECRDAACTIAVVHMHVPGGFTTPTPLEEGHVELRPGPAKDRLEALAATTREAARGVSVQCEEHEGKHPFDPATCAGAVTDGPTRYPVDPKERARLLDVFTYHKPQGDQTQRYALLRASAYDLACLVSDLTPPGRERSLALTHIETAVMFANAAIARGE
jgi:hypothetical protein